MTETRVFGDLQAEGLEVVQIDDRLFVRYDAGAHQVVWRQDEISKSEFDLLRSGESGLRTAILNLQHRLGSAAVDPYVSNWTPPNTR